MKDGKYDVFISYSHFDKEVVFPYVQQISKALKRECWIDKKGIESGVEFEDVIIKAIDECKVVLFMLSDNSLRSKWTKREVFYAEDEGKRIVPILVDGNRLRGWFKFHFGNVDFINIHSDEQREKLVSNLRSWLGMEEEEEKLRAEEERRRKDEELRRKTELQRMAEEEAKKQRERKEREEALRRAEEEKRRKQAEERKKLEEERKRLAEQRSRAEEEIRRREEEKNVREVTEALYRSKKKLSSYLLTALAVLIVAVVAVAIGLSKSGVEDTATVNQSEKNKTFMVNGVSFTMVYVEGGTFTIGATSEQGSDADDDEKLTHSVTLSSYYIGETEVTQDLWMAVMGTTVSQQRDQTDKSSLLRGEGINYPMYLISWDECQEFISRLNSMTDQHFCLPTEAQWEYAARGGNRSRGYKYSGSNDVDDVAWYADNGDYETHPVKTKQPNELGIYDMSGNVWEWCQDWYEDYSSGAQTNPTGASSGSRRVRRGGGWVSHAWSCRSSCRGHYASPSRFFDLGMRLALPSE